MKPPARQPCPDCGKPLLRYITATKAGATCSGCSAPFVLIHWRPSPLGSHFSDRGARPIDYQIRETPDGRVAVRVDATLSPRQARLLQDSIGDVVHLVQDWIDESSGKHEWGVVPAGRDRFEVRRGKDRAVAVPITPRRIERCDICETDKPAKSPMWRPLESAGWQIRRSHRFCDPCIKTLSGVASPLTDVHELLAAHQGKAEV